MSDTSTTSSSSSSNSADEEISAGLGNYAQFRDEMRAMIPKVVVEPTANAFLRPLAGLHLDSPSDPTVALVDAFAAVADIISFYQDRILNEGFLPSALEYTSLSLLGRSIGEGAGIYVGATAELALFAQPGDPVLVPAGSAVQASPPKSASGTGGGAAGSPSAGGAASVAGPIFETLHDVTADPALNQLSPLQTRPARLDPETDALLLAGTGLGLQVGEFLLLASTRIDPVQWVRLTVFSVTENHVLLTTAVGIGSPLEEQWHAGGATATIPRNADEGLAIYAFDLTCRLFGYNAPSWSSQTYSVQLANTPPSQSPGEYSDWPGFAIDLSDLDLQAVYPKVLPGSQFLLETPESKTLGVIAAVSRQNLSEFGMSGQSTQVTLEANPATLPGGTSLIPARTGHTASLLADGRVLIAGGIGVDGLLDSVQIFDPATALVTPLAPLPGKRAMHSATTIDGVVWLAGGITDGWALATDLLVLDPATLSFAVADAPPLATPRIEHAATALPDGTLMLSGGLTFAPAVSDTPPASLDDLLAMLAATPSVTVYSPAAKAWLWEAGMQHARAGHSATLCPVVKSATDGGSADLPPIGAIVVFLGGHDGGAMPVGETGATATPGTVWNDAEVTDPVDWKPVPGLYVIASGADTGSARYDHVATLLPGSNGFVVTGGQSGTAAVSDNWLVGALAQYTDATGTTFTGAPVFAPAPALRTARSDHAAALLQSGKLIVAGGQAGGTILASVELFPVDSTKSIPFDPAAVIGAGTQGLPLPGLQTDPAWAALDAGPLLLAGGLGSLPNGYLDSVVVYDPEIGTVIEIPGPPLSDLDTLAPVGTIALRDGTILITGSTSPSPPPFPWPPTALTGYAWTFDPATGLSTATTGAPVVARIGATLTLLPNGTVLVAGGMGIDPKTGYGVLDTAEIYDPNARTFRAIGNTMTVPRCGHTATPLPDGTVLIAGGFYFPPIGYDPGGLIAAFTPSLDSAEIFSPSAQKFAAVATTLPQGFALHAATQLPGGDVLITGGTESIYAYKGFYAADFTLTIAPIAQAAVYNATAGGFAVIPPLETARALHSATLLASGDVLVAGGAVDAAQAATASTELFDPRTLAFVPAADLSSPRKAQGAMLVPEGLLLIGGAAESSYEVIPPDGKGGEPVYPLPFAMPSPAFPPIVELVQWVVPISLGGYGVFAFGGDVAEGGGSSCTGILYVEAPVPPGEDARRQALVYTQSSPLSLAPPIDNRPIEGRTLVLAGLVGVTVGQSLVIAGNPPLAQTVGQVQSVDGSPPLDPGTLVMALAELPVPDTPSATAASPGAGQQWWQVQDAASGMRTIATGAGPPPSALYFLSGNGTTIGNVTSAQLALYDRPLLSESFTVQHVSQSAAANTTTISLNEDLVYLYDRTTTLVYGNVVPVTQGSTVTDEVLGSGDGKLPFQAFMLRQAPLTWLEEAEGTIEPQITVSVGGVDWQLVDALADCGPDSRAYQLIQDGQGRAQIQFGDGERGMRLPTGANNITATYRVGAGANGNVAAGSLTRAPSNVGGIKSVLNPLAASGGLDPAPRSTLRSRIPIGVTDLGRIVTQADMLSFVLNRPEVGEATLSTPTEAPTTSLITVTGPDNAVPDPRSASFASLKSAFDHALAAPLLYDLFAYVPVPFKLGGTFQYRPGADPQAVLTAMVDAIDAAYGPGAMTFGQAVRHAEIVRLLESVPDVTGVEVTELWVPTRPDTPRFLPVLRAKPASLVPPLGAEILSISPDADAVGLKADNKPATGT